ncbi:hypothetical protein EU528_10270, partial [Candidatus Thorarchaeota archaeon]
MFGRLVEDHRMKKSGLNESKNTRRLVAIGIILIILVASFPFIMGLTAPITKHFSDPFWKSNFTNRERIETKPEAYVEDVTLSENGMSWDDMGTGSESGTPAEITYYDDNNTGITVLSEVNGFWYGNTSYNESQFNNIDLPAASPRTIIGQPQIPRLTFTVEVPSNVEISVDILSASWVLLVGYNISPTQIPSIGVEEKILPPFSIDTTTYSSDSFYPDYNYSLSGQNSITPIILRGRRLVQVSTYPVQASPGLGQLKAYTQFEIRIVYDHEADIEPVDISLVSNAFESLYQRIILNFQPWVASATITTTITTTLLPTTSVVTTPGISPDALFVGNFIPADET